MAGGLAGLLSDCCRPLYVGTGASALATMRLLVVASLLLSAAGCIDFHCGPQTVSASWVDPSLFPALPGPVTPAEQGLPFAFPTDPEANLTSISWSSGPIEGHAVLGGEEQLTVFAWNRTSPETVGAWARAFLANVSGAPVPQQEVWVGHLVTNAEPQASYASEDGETFFQIIAYSVQTQGPYTVDPPLPSASSGGGRGVGTARVNDGDWTFHYSYPSKAVDLGRVRLEADTRGQAGAEFDPAFGNTTAARAALDEALARIGQPPAPEDVVFSQIVC